MQIILFFLQLFSPYFSFFDQASNSKIPWNKTDKTPTFTGIPPHVTILTMLESIRTYQDGMADEVSDNIVSEFSKRGTFGGFSEDMMHSLLEGMLNKVEYALKYSQKMAGRFEEFSD